MHNAYLNLVQTVLSGESQVLVEALFAAELPEVILETVIYPCVNVKGTDLRKGNLGHVYKLANLLRSSIENHELITSNLKKVEG